MVHIINDRDEKYSRYRTVLKNIKGVKYIRSTNTGRLFKFTLDTRIPGATRVTVGRHDVSLILSVISSEELYNLINEYIAVGTTITTYTYNLSSMVASFLWWRSEERLEIPRGYWSNVLDRLRRAGL